MPPFAYNNVLRFDPAGKRSHVELQVNRAEAAIVRRIFAVSAAGTGYTRTAKLLNVAFDGNQFNRTAVTAPLFNYLAPSESAEEKMVSR